MIKFFAREGGWVVLNQGVSFGVGSSQGVWVFVLLTGVVLVGLYALFTKIWQKNLVLFGVLSGAAVSNVLDRFVVGGVQDFLPLPMIHLRNNLADWVIFGCLVWLGWKVLSSRSRA